MDRVGKNELQNESQMNDIGALGTLLVSILALGLSLTIFLSRRKKRRKLIDAIYHHVTVAESDLETQRKSNEEIRENIRRKESYTPYFVVVSPAANDLIYNQVIEAMGWLNLEEGKVLLRYFYKQSDLHTLAQSFNSEYVRSWGPERKLAMWDDLDKGMKETIECARNVKAILVKKWNFG